MTFAGTFRIGAATLLLAVAGCTTKYCAVGDSAKGDGGIYCYAIGEDQPETFSPVGTLNYLIAGTRRNLFYGTVRDLPGGLKNDGGVVLLRRDRGDRFTVVASAPTRSDNPCHLSLAPDGKFLFTANYGSGTVSVLPLRNGLPGEAKLRYHTGGGPVARRQQAPHSHYAGFDPQGGALYVTDLGNDSIYVYRYHPGTGLSRVADQILILHPGAGPRHLVFTPAGDVLFVANELDSTVTSFRKNLITGRWHSALTLPTRFRDDPKVRNYPGAIIATRDGRFFLITNRGANTIALFENYGGGRFTLLAEVPSGGDFPYDLAFADRETHLIVPHRKSGNVTHFRFDREAGTLSQLSEAEKVPVAVRVMAK